MHPLNACHRWNDTYIDLGLLRPSSQHKGAFAPERQRAGKRQGQETEYKGEGEGAKGEGAEDICSRGTKDAFG